MYPSWRRPTSVTTPSPDRQSVACAQQSAVKSHEVKGAPAVRNPLANGNPSAVIKLPQAAWAAGAALAPAGAVLDKRLRRPPPLPPARCAALGFCPAAGCPGLQVPPRTPGVAAAAAPLRAIPVRGEAWRVSAVGAHRMGRFQMRHSPSLSGKEGLVVSSPLTHALLRGSRQKLLDGPPPSTCTATSSASSSFLFCCILALPQVALAAIDDRTTSLCSLFVIPAPPTTTHSFVSNQPCLCLVCEALRVPSAASRGRRPCPSPAGGPSRPWPWTASNRFVAIPIGRHTASGRAVTDASASAAPRRAPPEGGPGRLRHH